MRSIPASFQCDVSFACLFICFTFFVVLHSHVSALARYTFNVVFFGSFSIYVCEYKRKYRTSTNIKNDFFFLRNFYFYHQMTESQGFFRYFTCFLILQSFVLKSSDFSFFASNKQWKIGNFIGNFNVNDNQTL